MASYNDTKGAQMSYMEFERLMNEARDYRYGNRKPPPKMFRHKSDFEALRRRLSEKPKIEIYEDLPTSTLRVVMGQGEDKLMTSIPMPIGDYEAALQDAAQRLYYQWQKQFGRVGMDERQFIMEVMQCAVEQGLLRQMSATQWSITSTKKWEKTGSTSETSSDPDQQSVSLMTPSTSLSERFTSSLKGLRKSPAGNRKIRLPA
jgi:hypothetical protein